MPKPLYPHPPPHGSFGNLTRGQFSSSGQGSFPSSNPNVWINPWFKGHNNSPANNFIRQNGYDYQKGHNSQWADQYQGNYPQYNTPRNDYPVRNNFFPKSKFYSGDLNSQLVWYSDQRDLFDLCMVHSSYAQFYGISVFRSPFG